MRSGVEAGCDGGARLVDRLSLGGFGGGLGLRCRGAVRSRLGVFVCWGGAGVADLDRVACAGGDREP